MASICCQVYEEKVVSSLCRPHSRSDNKLTDTERERLSSTFARFWLLLMESLDISDTPHDRLAVLDNKELFRVREVAIFIMSNVPESKRLEMARLMGDSHRWNEDTCLKHLLDIVMVIQELLESRGRGRWNPPYRAPLAYSSLFDHWQADYMEQFDESVPASPVVSASPEEASAENPFLSPDELREAQRSWLPVPHLAACFLCSMYEEIVVDSLCPPHVRPDKKLTPTERERLTRYFSLAWHFATESLEYGTASHAAIPNLPSRDIFSIREVLVFLVLNVQEPRQRELAHLMGGGDKWEEIKNNELFLEVARACLQVLDDRGVGNPTHPRKTPLAYFAMFDHWQEEYMEQFDHEYRTRHLRK
ncbi:hypothetical protein CC86DRAFT_366090 [Ophiobolus disseminans]|uniref:Uncharacterized protein n=1 Tax=Ophiobolus disseminans TaxID=1469910 RepID=A0A6A7AGH0_9PLEO|nr:hypothetical protein CC86DRAFT_366090 [Ophiobolus disseminans]